MANEFSFGPNPAYPFGGSGAVMGRALLLGLTNGLNLMDMYDEYMRHSQTTPSWIAAQQAMNGAEQSRANLQSAQDQNGLGWQLGAMGANPSSYGYGPHSLEGLGAGPGAFAPLASTHPALPPPAPTHPAYPDANSLSSDYGGDADFNPITPTGNGSW